MNLLEGALYIQIMNFLLDLIPLINLLQNIGALLQTRGYFAISTLTHLFPVPKSVTQVPDGLVGLLTITQAIVGGRIHRV